MYQEQKHSLLRLFLTSPRMLLYYLGASLVLLILNSEFLLGNMTQLVAATGEALPYLKESMQNLLLDASQHKISAGLTTAFFWGVLGSLVYVMIWIVTNLTAGARNKLVEKLFFINRGSPLFRFKYLLLKLHKTVLVSGLILILLFVTLASTFIVLPMAVSLFQIFQSQWYHPLGWLDMLSAMLSIMFICHIYVVLFRLLTFQGRDRLPPIDTRPVY